jgi:predicted TIM-barrel fold metal-dependent hydrolase
LAREDGDVLRLTLEAMDRYNIVLAFLSDPEDSVGRWVAAAPQRFIPGFAMADPAKVDLPALRRTFEIGKMRGMGELANQYAGIPANDPRMDPLFALAAELDLPTLVHSTGVSGPSDSFRIAAGHPELLDSVLQKYPGLRLYLENAGFPFLEETIAILYRYPNVYVDVSTITWINTRPMFHRYLRGLVDAGLSKRIMFGSDQMFWPETIPLAIEAIESAEFLTSEQKRDIFYNNAARFLRLSDEQIAGHYGK